jgi:hypothetical protein
LLLPETDTSKVEGILKEFGYYACLNFHLADILTKNFIEGFIRNGKFYSIPSRIQSPEDTFLLLKNKLELTVHKDSITSSGSAVLSSFALKSEGDFLRELIL